MSSQAAGRPAEHIAVRSPVCVYPDLLGRFSDPSRTDFVYPAEPGVTGTAVRLAPPRGDRSACVTLGSYL